MQKDQSKLIEQAQQEHQRYQAQLTQWEANDKPYGTYLVIVDSARSCGGGDQTSRVTFAWQKPKQSFKRAMHEAIKKRIPKSHWENYAIKTLNLQS